MVGKIEGMEKKEDLFGTRHNNYFIQKIGA